MTDGLAKRADSLDIPPHWCRMPMAAKRKGDEVNMTRVDAIYQGGVFRPLEPVALCENQRVALSVEPIAKEDPLAWIKRVGDFRRQMAAERGIFPDSAVEIAADRTR